VADRVQERSEEDPGHNRFVSRGKARRPSSNRLSPVWAARR
jgi:hypothetical protein